MQPMSHEHSSIMNRPTSKYLHEHAETTGWAKNGCFITCEAV